MLRLAAAQQRSDDDRIADRRTRHEQSCDIATLSVSFCCYNHQIFANNFFILSRFFGRAGAQIWATVQIPD